MPRCNCIEPNEWREVERDGKTITVCGKHGNYIASTPIMRTPEEVRRYEEKFYGRGRKTAKRS